MTRPLSSTRRPRNRIRYFTSGRSLTDNACENNCIAMTTPEYVAHTAKCDALMAEMARLNRIAFAAFQAQPESVCA